MPSIKEAVICFGLTAIFLNLLTPTSETRSSRLLDSKAPVSDYFPPNRVAEINVEIDRISERPDPDVCGGLAVMEEELTIWERAKGPQAQPVSRRYPQELVWGCQFDPKDGKKVQPAVLTFEQPVNGKEAAYAMEANVAWNLDRGIEARLEGTVKDEKGSPLEGAMVRVAGLERDYRAVAKTNGQGFYTLELPSDIYEIAIDPEGCQRKTLVSPVCAYGTAEGGPGLPEGVQERAAGERRVTMIDFVTPCTEYYIQDTDERTISVPISVVEQTRKEAWIFTGKPTKRAEPDKFGWQTSWEVQGDFTADVWTSMDPTAFSPGVFIRCTPPRMECRGRDRDAGRFSFNASSVERVGDHIPITSVRSGVFRQEWSQCNPVVCQSPFVEKPITLQGPPEGMTETQSPTFTHDGEIVAFQGREGATIAMRVEGYESPYFLQIRRGRSAHSD